MIRHTKDSVNTMLVRREHGISWRLISLLDLPSDKSQRTLVDAACGTGLHLKHLAGHFRVEGLDIRPELLEIARERLTHQGCLRQRVEGIRRDDSLWSFTGLPSTHPCRRVRS